MKKILVYPLLALYVILHIIGMVLYLLGKLVKAAGYLFMRYTGSARNELRDFLVLKYDISDL